MGYNGDLFQESYCSREVEVILSENTCSIGEIIKEWVIDKDPDMNIDFCELLQEDLSAIESEELSPPEPLEIIQEQVEMEDKEISTEEAGISPSPQTDGEFLKFLHKILQNSFQLY